MFIAPISTRERDPDTNEFLPPRFPVVDEDSEEGGYNGRPIVHLSNRAAAQKLADDINALVKAALDADTERTTA